MFSFLAPLVRRTRLLDQVDNIPDPILTLMLSATTCELFSLEPKARKPSGATFRGWKVLGQVTMKRQKDRDLLVSALRRGANENDTMAAGCFVPRHGLRFAGNDQALDLVICFHCLSVYAYRGDERGENFLVSDSPQTVFDAVLERSGVQLAEPE